MEEINQNSLETKNCNNEKNPEDYDLNYMYKEALGFRKTYDILNGYFVDTNIDLLNKVDFLTPLITSIIFSCELYIKILIIVSGKSFKYEHTLEGLFNILPESMQDSIRFDIINNKFQNIVESENKNETITFDKILKKNSKSYTYFRYYFSYKDTKSFDLYFFQKFNDILYNLTTNKLFSKG